MEEEESKAEDSVQARSWKEMGGRMKQKRLLMLRKLSSRPPKGLYKGGKDRRGHSPRI